MKPGGPQPFGLLLYMLVVMATQKKAAKSAATETGGEPKRDHHAKKNRSGGNQATGSTGQQQQTTTPQIDASSVQWRLGEYVASQLHELTNFLQVAALNYSTQGRTHDANACMAMCGRIATLGGIELPWLQQTTAPQQNTRFKTANA